MNRMRGIWRLTPEERRHDWFKRHHRVVERLFDAPVGALTKIHPAAPQLDGFCAPKNSEGMPGWTEPWNHSAWVSRDWINLPTTGKWWRVSDDLSSDECPVCLAPCRLQVGFAEGQPNPQLDRVEFVPWDVLTDSMELFLSEKEGLPWARKEGESLLDYTTRNFRVTKLVGYDVGSAPVAYTLRITDGVRTRYLVCSVPFEGSSTMSCDAVTESAMDALLFRINHLGARGPEELDGEDLEARLEGAA